MTIHWVFGVGQSPVCQILLQIAVRMLVATIPPACINSASILSTLADFPFLIIFLTCLGWCLFFLSSHLSDLLRVGMLVRYYSC